MNYDFTYEFQPVEGLNFWLGVTAPTGYDDPPGRIGVGYPDTEAQIDFSLTPHVVIPDDTGLHPPQAGEGGL
jgi:hypothetical protein